MTKEEKIAKIYEKVADKTLSEGCIIESKRLSLYPENPPEKGTVLIVTRLHNKGNINIKNFQVMNSYTEGLEIFNFEDLLDYNIIGHPVMINTCIFNIYKYNNGDIKIIQELLNMWDNKLEPIEKCGNDLCIDYVFNLLPKE